MTRSADGGHPGAYDDRVPSANELNPGAAALIRHLRSSPSPHSWVGERAEPLKQKDAVAAAA